MSMDLDPVPGLPLLTTLFCNSTTVKKKTTVKCAFPAELYTKKAAYGSPIGAGVGLLEIALILIFIVLSFKMKRDVTKVFLSVVYIPLGLSAVFKLALAVYSTMMGAYGWCWNVFLMFYNWMYTSAVLTTAVGSVLYLCALIIVARKRQNFKSCDSWVSYFSVLFFSLLLSGSYHLIAVQWNQLPAAGLFFTYLLATVGTVVNLLVCLCVGLLCKRKASPEVVVLTGDPSVDDARSRLAYGAVAVILMNVPHWFEIWVKITELFTPYLWDSDAQNAVFYSSQAATLLLLDTVRLFLSFFMLAAIFVTGSGRFALSLWLHREPHPLSSKSTTKTATTTAHHHQHGHQSAQNKVFVASQNQPLLMETGETKKEPAHHEKKEHPIIPTSTTTTTTNSPLPLQIPPPVPLPNQIPVNAPAPPQYPGIGFAPGMLQLPHNMQTTIVYTPSVAYENVNGHVTMEQLR